MKIKNVFKLILFSAVVSIYPCCAQTWVKVSKEVSKQAVKVLNKQSSKTTNVIHQTNNSAKSSFTSGNVGVSATRVASQYTTEKCTKCSARGWYFYNGYKYKCSSCNGTGYKVVKR